MERDDGYAAIRDAYNRGAYDAYQHAMPGRTTQKAPDAEAYVEELKKQPLRARL